MLDLERAARVTGRLDPPGAAAFVDAIAPREVRLLAGLDAASLYRALAGGQLGAHAERGKGVTRTWKVCR